MFTGIIQDVGTVAKINRTAAHADLTFETSLPATCHSKVGDSLAINGVCLTITQLVPKGFTTTIMPETSRRSTLGDLATGERVNLEPALGVMDRLDGHFVLGHVDTTTRLLKRETDENAVVLTFTLPAQCQNEVVFKGSVALDGVSLTVSAITADSFSVSLIPHTLDQTILADLRPHDRVNLETDILGKYLNQLEGTKHEHN
ncbi:riboflavin synthase [Levilactobacillus suantsaii]|uniref:Riboflavin synthase n=1 Tax=Levilactobacillus suantsaii TaxID=2292255 RepID=A0A4Q0VJP6_9LACO|nr:riboflavin synthase [Levilactobacillus suantsaii]RXI78104.1 riboflavin synthase [Levilactobacillus suantsaii]